MITLLSPAKTLNYKEASSAKEVSIPEMLSESERLASVLKKKSPKKIAELMHVNEAIAQLNYERYQVWNTPFDTENAKQAIHAFQGDVYRGLKADSFSEADLKFAQSHLRILSGLYGLLKPLDLIQAYRLEMGTKLKTTRGKNLYEFWKDRITDKLNESLEHDEEAIIINLASNEYFNSINTKKLKAKVITPTFKDLKNGEYKFIQTYGKEARGYLSRYIIKNKVNRPEDLKGFDLEGYYYSSDMSTDAQPVFLRDH